MFDWFLGEVRKQTQLHIRGTALALGHEGVA
jgi:hypothetical protein